MKVFNLLEKFLFMSSNLILFPLIYFQNYKNDKNAAFSYTESDTLNQPVYPYEADKSCIDHGISAPSRNVAVFDRKFLQDRSK